MLDARAICKRFGGIDALAGVSLQCASGEIHGLIGPNGAGKTSLINVLGGVLRPDAGTVLVDGVDITARGPEYAARSGVGRTFQNLRLFSSLTVRQNIEVAAITARAVRPQAAAAFDLEGELAALGLRAQADSEVSTLPYGSQRRVEILRAVALCPTVLLLDEPAAGMNTEESAKLGVAIKRICELHSPATIVIDHDLHFIMNLCPTITVMDMGRVIAQGSSREVRANPRVIEVYIGGG